MLTFDHEFASDSACGCLLWADGPSMKRVQFSIGPLILQDVLQAEILCTTKTTWPFASGSGHASKTHAVAPLRTGEVIALNYGRQIFTGFRVRSCARPFREAPSPSPRPPQAGANQPPSPNSPQPRFGLPAVLVAVRASHASCEKVGKREYSRQFRSHLANPG